MNFLTFFILLFVLVALAFLLPVFAGVGSFKVERSRKQTSQKKKKDEEPQFEGYLPPDELKRRQEETKKPSRLAKIKDNLNVSKQDFPLKFSGNFASEDTTLRRRGIKKDNDPSTFDFDLDAFILDQNREDWEDAKREEEERLAQR